MVVLLEVILPIFLVAGAGVLIGCLSRLDPTLPTRIVLYLLVPSLIFRSLYTATIAGQDVLQIAAFVVILQIALLLVSRILGRALRWDEDTRAAGSLMMTFTNGGVYGLAVLRETLGVGIAAWRKGMHIRSWAAQALRVPWLYALLVALVFRATGWELHVGLCRGIDLLASAGMPVALIVLGIRLSRVPLRGIAREAVWPTGLKLALPPLLAWRFTGMLGVEGLLRSVLIAEASMPSAINALILSMHFNRRPELAATVLFLTTALSLGTLTLILSVLN
jgi:predicted permease